MKLIKFILFNRITRTILDFDFGGAENKFPDRVKAFGVDVLYTFMVCFPFIGLGVLLSRIAQKLMEGHVSEAIMKLTTVAILLPLFGLFFIAVNKDFYNGRSIVNRLWGFQVVDVKTGNPPDRFKCMLRNLTAPIFPIELLVVLFNRERRIGDFIAGTKLIRVEKRDPQLILNEIEHTVLDQGSIPALVVPTVLYVGWVILVLTTD